MSLIVYPDDGYDSYVSLDDANTIISEKSIFNSQWLELTDTEKEVYLRISKDYIDLVIDKTLFTTINTSCLKQVNSMMAIQDVSNKISSEINRNNGLVTKEKVGNIEVTYKQNDKFREILTRYPKLIRPCLVNLGATFNSNKQVKLGKS